MAETYGTFQVFEQLGSGGMATVHRAEMMTPKGKREVALKRLNPSLDKKTVTLFQDEARLLSYLHHPNIPETYESGRVFGTYYIAMEYVKGPTLKQVIEHCADTVGPMPQEIALDLIGQLCDALDYAHKRTDERGRPLNIIHRDVTPSNLILDPTGTLKLVDFGLAKAALASEPSSAGIIKGKLGYVAPEYTHGTIDHRADLWAVGIILYELLTGRRLFDGPHAVDTISRVRELPIPRPSVANPQVSPDVDEIAMSALARDPRQRWPSAASMATRIRAVAAKLAPTDSQRVSAWVTSALAMKPGERPPAITPVAAMPVVPAEPTQPVARSNMQRNLIVAGAVALLVIVLLVLIAR